MTDSEKDRLAVDALPGYEPEIGRLLWMLEDSRRRTKSWLENLADSDLDLVPAPGCNSIGTILYHLAVIEADWLYVEIQEFDSYPAEAKAMFPDDVRDEAGRLTVSRGSSLATHLDRLDAVRTQVLASFRGMSLAEFRRERNLPDYAASPEYVLHHLMQHEAEHRGEIGMLRSLAQTNREYTAS